jgi:hypothetical protein
MVLLLSCCEADCLAFHNINRTVSQLSTLPCAAPYRASGLVLDRQRSIMTGRFPED